MISVPLLANQLDNYTQVFIITPCISR